MSLEYFFLYVFCFQIILLARINAAWPFFQTHKTEFSQNEPIIGKGTPAASFDSTALQIKSKRISELDTSLPLNKALSQLSCWQRAHFNMATSCRDVLKNETLKSHFSVYLTNCFLLESGRNAYHCTDSMSIKQCTSRMNDHAHSVYLAFFLDVDALCHHLQSEAFKREMENSINDLKMNSHLLEDELFSMNRKAKTISRSMENLILNQNRMHDLQFETNSNLDHHMENLHRNAQELSIEITKLASEQKNVTKTTLATTHKLLRKFFALKESTKAISREIERGLRVQAMMMRKQSEAVLEINELKRLQGEYMRDHDAAMRQMLASSQSHFEASMEWHGEMERSQHSLFRNSVRMLKAQEKFMTNQTDLFHSLEKLFALYHSFLLYEKNIVKTFLFYLFVYFIFLILTSSKQTNSARFILSLIVCASFLFEIMFFHFSKFGISAKMVGNFVKLNRFFVISIMFQIFACTAFRYKDFSLLNHHLLKSQNQILNELKENIIRQKETLNDNNYYINNNNNMVSNSTEGTKSFESVSYFSKSIKFWISNSILKKAVMRKRGHRLDAKSTNKSFFTQCLPHSSVGCEEYHKYGDEKNDVYDKDDEYDEDDDDDDDDDDDEYIPPCDFIMSSASSCYNLRSSHKHYSN